MYGVPGTDKAFGEVKALGVNMVHTYTLTSGEITNQKIKEIKKYLDKANSYNLKVLFDLNGDKKVKNGQLEEVVNLVEMFKNHPAIGYWYLFDEPDNKNVSSKELAPFYNRIKEISPNIPVAICHAWTKNWSSYEIGRASCRERV